MTLQELPNTVVHCPTKAIYDELMKMYEDAGWVWNEGNKPTSCDFWYDEKKNTCVQIKSIFGYSYRKWYKNKGYKIITFAQFKKLQGLTKKKQQEVKTTEFTIWKDPSTNKQEIYTQIYIEILEWLYMNDVCIQREAFIKKLRELLEVK